MFGCVWREKCREYYKLNYRVLGDAWIEEIIVYWTPDKRSHYTDLILYCGISSFRTIRLAAVGRVYTGRMLKWWLSFAVVHNEVEIEWTSCSIVFQQNVSEGLPTRTGKPEGWNCISLPAFQTTGNKHWKEVSGLRQKSKVFLKSRHQLYRHKTPLSLWKKGENVFL